MKWGVIFTNKAEKQAKKLNTRTLSALTTGGPILYEWPNYGKLHSKGNEDKYHCHLIKGRPTYICCWEMVVDKKIKMIKIYYVGTHENAPY
jgi:hypothetical protein